MTVWYWLDSCGYERGIRLIGVLMNQSLTRGGSYGADEGDRERTGALRSLGRQVDQRRFRDLEDYVNHHYLILPVVDKQGRPWLVDGKPVYCLRGSQYETVSDERVHLARCPDCGGMGIRTEEFVVESDCIHCTACGYEFDARLEMMET
jgi:predicted Zn-ribbon and HTH transcriptional regulator